MSLNRHELKESEARSIKVEEIRVFQPSQGMPFTSSCRIVEYLSVPRKTCEGMIIVLRYIT